MCENSHRTELAQPANPLELWVLEALLTVQSESGGELKLKEILALIEKETTETR